VPRYQNAAHIIQLALRHRMPAVSEQAEWAKGGLLFSYSQDRNWSAERACVYIDKILRGLKPSDLPVEQATKVQLTINLKLQRRSDSGYRPRCSPWIHR
jgi:putative ABC transport system substrate-binding protein